MLHVQNEATKKCYQITDLSISFYKRTLSFLFRLPAYFLRASRTYHSLKAVVGPKSMKVQGLKEVSGYHLKQVRA